MFDDFEDNGGEEEDSSDAEYADIDATADDNVFGGTQKDKTSVSEKESIVFSRRLHENESTADFEKLLLLRRRCRR